ncbi:MAG: family 43 glycosylhydrolase [Eubacteriales bacterium]
MKRILSILVALATLAVFVSCNRTPPSPSSSVESDTTTSTDLVPSGNAPVITPVEQTEIQKESIMNVSGNSFTQTYENPLISLKTPNVWPGYGVGDPFVMRWNGRYYLYCSTKDGNLGIQCWSSDDLITWKYKGLCAREVVTVTAYAPEVVYYNGYFYMYTSPAGNGHYVLRSSSPTGPFKAITDNFGHSIDGSVFIDDDGKWYFYSASGGGIMVYPMSAPDKVSDSGTNTGANMNGWTEGPMVIKVNGVYYLTYTGNHVWCNGYRINYATSTRSPSYFTAADNNPILVNTLSLPQGIGHSSTVMGPNMDSYYIVYHSSLGAPMREMRIDRLVFNGSTMEVLGPTISDQQAPEMPDLYSYFTESTDLDNWYSDGASISDSVMTLSDGGWVLAKYSYGENYTAECNVASISGGKAGMVFSYTNEYNYGTALFDPDGQNLIVTFMVNGVPTVHEKALKNSFKENTDFSKLQLLTVRKDGGSFTFLVNNRTLCTLESDLGTGAFGATSEGGTATIGFMGISGEVNQSSIKSYFKPISGSVQAITCVEDDVTTVAYQKMNLVSLSADGHLNYLVNVAKTAGYDLGISYRSSTETKLKLYQNQTEIGELILPATDSKMTTVTFRNLPLTKGMSAITFAAVSGSCEIGSYTFLEYTAVTAIDLNYSTSTDKNRYSDGTWTIANGVLSLGGDTPLGKRLYGSESWGDYTAEADITLDSSSINFGMLIRATNPSVGGAGNDVVAGTDFVQGYFIGLTGSTVVLGKQNYSWEVLTTANFRTQSGGTYHMKVEAVGATLKIWVDGNLLIEYTDPDPFLQGMAGFRGHYSAASVDNFTVTAN